jgi:DNA-binding NarL/FixJ family response regulator
LVAILLVPGALLGQTNVITTVAGRGVAGVTLRGIRQLLQSQAEIEIVGEAANFAQTIQMTNGLNPQVVILDLHMPDQKTISLQDVKSHLNRRSQVLAISVWNDEESRELAETLGAAVLLDKTDLGNRLITTIMQLSRERCASA